MARRLGSPPRGDASVARLVATADELGLEIQRCDIAGLTWQWEGYARYGVLCPDRGARLPAVALGTCGIALRTTRAGREVLLAVGPDAFLRHASGAIDDIGDTGRGWLDLHALELAPGRHAELVRLGGANTFWHDAELPGSAERAIVNLVWPPSAAKPELLVADITSEPLASLP